MASKSRKRGDARGKAKGSSAGNQPPEPVIEGSPPIRSIDALELGDSQSADDDTGDSLSWGGAITIDPAAISEFGSIDSDDSMQSTTGDSGAGRHALDADDAEEEDEEISVGSMWEISTSGTAWGEDAGDPILPLDEGAIQNLMSFDDEEVTMPASAGEGYSVPSSEETVPGRPSNSVGEDEATVVSGDPEKVAARIAQRRAQRFDKDGDGHTGAAADGGTLPISLNSQEINQEIARLDHEVTWLMKRDRQDDALSTLHMMVRMKPDDSALIERYEELQLQVISTYFPGKNLSSVASLTVEPSELPDLVKDPVMGAILGRLDGRVSLGELDSALSDVAPGVLYGLLSRAKGMGLIRLD